MNEPKRPSRRGRRPRTRDAQATEPGGEPNPYRDTPEASSVSTEAPAPRRRSPRAKKTVDVEGAAPESPSAKRPAKSSADAPAVDAPAPSAPSAPADRERHTESRPEPRHESRTDARADGDRNEPRGEPRNEPRNESRNESRSDSRNEPRTDNRPESRSEQQTNSRNGQRRNSRRGRGRFRKDRGERAPREQREQRPPREARESREPREAAPPTVVEGMVTGWFDLQRDAGFIRRAEHSYLPEPTDPFIQPTMVRQHALRRGDKIEASWGRDHRGRAVLIEITSLNDGPPIIEGKRPDFNTLTASYPDRKLTLETEQTSKNGPELTRRAIDVIAPIGYGQRALIVAPARAGKTTLLQAIVEGVATNHPAAALFILLVDERPEEVSEMIDWGYGEVVASSFDMPAKRHVEVADMVLERSRRLVEQGKDVVIVLDSITRLARAHNTVERGTGRTLSGGLDSSAMQKPKAFFGSARMISPENGGGSLTIIATALVETGSRMDDVIFEEFKGTGNCEIKLDRSLADRRIYPAFDIAVSGTRREEKLYRPDQLQKVHLLRRGLAQMPPQAGMEWLIKRIAGTPNNDSLLDGL